MKRKKSGLDMINIQHLVSSEKYKLFFIKSTIKVESEIL